MVYYGAGLQPFVLAWMLDAASGQMLPNRCLACKTRDFHVLSLLDYYTVLGMSISCFQ